MAQSELSSDREQLEKAIAAQESLRGTLDDATIDATIATLQEKLDSLADGEQSELQRKQVSLLFMDIVSSTDIVRDLDPEDNMLIMERALKYLAAPIDRHGGHVARFMGDGFKAVFGHPVASENDPERSVLAGLDILTAAENFRKDVLGQWNIEDFDVRVGINTGLVIIGGQSEAEDTITGAAVNLAARIESAAEPGTVLISYNTYQHVEAGFDLEPQAPIQVKGFPEPVQVYEVLRLKQWASRFRRPGVEGVETRMVGREAEMLVLKDEFYNAFEDSERRVVTILGEAGVGKSRLVDEFENWVDQSDVQVRFYRGRASLQAQGIPYGLLRNTFAFQFEIKDDDQPSVVCEKFEAGIQEALGVDEITEKKAHFIGQLLGYDFKNSAHIQSVLEDPQVIRDRAMDHLVEYFKVVSSREGVLLLLDDLQWSDDSSLDGLNYLLLRLPDQAILVVATARHELLERRPHWGEGQDFHLHLNLRPLNKRHSRMLVEEVLQNVPEIPALLQGLVVDRAEGNPFYVEELIKILVEDRVIVKDEPSWGVDMDRMTEIRVPTTLTGVLQARLERLTDDERTVLQQSSVVGRVFWDAVVVRLNQAGNGGLDEEEIQSKLKSLRDREMIFQRESSVFSGTKEHIFKHAMLHDVSYESVLKRKRRTYHSVVADWLIENSHDREGEFLGLIADHLIKAGRTEQAVDYLQKAGLEAAARYANEEARAYFSQAIGWVDQSAQDKQQRIVLFHQRGQVDETLGDFEQARFDYEAALQLAADEDQLKGQWRAMVDLGKLWASRDYAIAREYFEQSLELASRMDNPALLASSLNWMGNWYANAENPQEAYRYHKKALEIFEQLGDQRGLAGTLDLLGMANSLAGDVHASSEHYDRAIALFRELNDQPNLASSLMIRSIGGPRFEYHAVVDLDPLEVGGGYLDQALQITLETDFRPGQCLAYWAKGLWSALSGQFGQALENLQMGLKIATKIGHKQWMVGNLSGLGMVYGYFLAGERTRSFSEQALELSKEIQSQYWIHMSVGTLARAYLLIGEPDQGWEYLGDVLHEETSMETIALRYCWARYAELSLAQHQPERALELIDQIISSIPGMEPGHVISSLWRLRGDALLELGKVEEAEIVFRTALENARRTGEQYIIWRLHANLGRLYRKDNHDAEAENEFSAARECIEKLADTIPDHDLKEDFRTQALKSFEN